MCVDVLLKALMSFAGNPIMQMLDMLLMMFIDIPERMNPGVSNSAAYNVYASHVVYKV